MANYSTPRKTVWSLEYSRDELLNESKDQYSKKEVSKAYRKEYSEDLKKLKEIRQLGLGANRKVRLLMYHYCDEDYSGVRNPSITFAINNARVDRAGQYTINRRYIYVATLDDFNNVKTEISCEKSGYSVVLDKNIANRFREVIISGKTLFPSSKMKPFSLQHQAAASSILALGLHSLTDLVAVYRAIVNGPDMLIRFGTAGERRNVIDFKSIVKHFMYLKSGRKPTKSLDDNDFWFELCVSMSPKPFCMKCCNISKFGATGECSCNVCLILSYSKYSLMLDDFSHRINCSQ